MRPPFPFIVGCGRSGTTLLRAMLDAHSELAIPPETRFVEAMTRDPSRYERPGGFDVEGFVRDLGSYAAFKHTQISEEAIRESFAAHPPDDCGDAIRAVFAAYAARNAKPRYGSKTPRDVLSIEQLSGVFPEAVFLHLIRDGRDVALSFLSVDFGPRSLPEAALQWNDFVRAGRAAGRALEPGRYVEIRYETMVQDPERILREVCPAIGLLFEPEMLRYHERLDRVMSGVPNPQAFESLKKPPTAKIRDWRSQMSSREVQLFDAIAGELLGELGYDRSDAAPSLGVRAHAARFTIGLRAKRRAAALRRRANWRR